MSSHKTSASDGSTAVGGNVDGSIFNVVAGDNTTITFPPLVSTGLPSMLGTVINVFAQESLSNYGTGARRELTEEVAYKLEHNHLASEHRLIVEYIRFESVLEQAYLGAEQYNNDARFLVRRKAGITYDEVLSAACVRDNVKPADKLRYVRDRADPLVKEVIGRLLEDYKKSKDANVYEETSHLAISLIVADAIVECEVLERP
jgi:hypothetical protein